MESEVWRNDSKSKVAVAKTDLRGNRIHEVVAPGKIVMITSDDRLFLNSQPAVAAELDPFSNGFLSPVKLIEGHEVASNPNHMSESDMRALFDLRVLPKFKSAVAEISSPIVLERLLTMASDESVNPTAKQVDALEARLAELRPQSTDTVGPVNVVGRAYSMTD
jgi:hypothetical protein